MTGGAGDWDVLGAGEDIIGRALRRWTAGQPLAAGAASARNPTAAEEKARSRAGDLGKRGSSRPVWCETRNGMPEFKPYVWRGKASA